MEKRLENFVGLILEASRLIQRIKTFETKAYGLKPVHVMCLFYLFQNKEGLSSKELASLTFEDKAAISRALSLLRNKSLAWYDETKYNSKITLTEEGMKVAEKICERANMAVNAGGEGLSEDERDNFYRSLGKINQNLTNYFNSLSEKGE